jgi:hypothetical protein
MKDLWRRGSTIKAAGITETDDATRGATQTCVRADERAHTTPARLSPRARRAARGSLHRRERAESETRCGRAETNKRESQSVPES